MGLSSAIASTLPKGLLLILFSSLALATNDTQTTSTSGLTWQNCTESDPPGLQCATLEVPLDWSDPNGTQITLGLSRFKAADSQNRIGSLFFNPGGPGAAASTFPIYQASGIPFFTDAVAENFDIIGLDPRGTGTSTPVQCDAAIWNERVSQFPTDEASFQKMVDHFTALGESCLELTGPVLRHLDTTSAARDMEAVRVALDDGKMSYLGLSYGTQLGMAYAELFPQSIRAMVLDANLDHSQSEASNLATESSTYENEFNRFSSWCSNTSTCALYGLDVGSLFDELVNNATANPIPAPECVISGECRGDVTGEEILFNVQDQLVFKDPLPELEQPGWETLALYLSEAISGNASGLSTSLALDNSSTVFAGLAISCLDWTHDSTTLSDVMYKEQLGSVIAPHTRGASQTYGIQTNCIGWPAPVQNPPHYANVTGTPAILLVNSDHDPECSYVWANGMLAQVSNGTLLTRSGDGHTSYSLNGTTTRAIDAYLVSGEIPPPNTVYTS